MNPPDLEQEEIDKFTNMINSTYTCVQEEGLVGLRRLISNDDHRPIQKVVDSGIVPKLLEIVTCHEDPQFQIESSWCIINVCSGEAKFVDYIIELGGLDILMNLFDSANNEAAANVLFAVRNIAATGTKYRDMCLEKDCVNKLLERIEVGDIPMNILEEIISTIDYLCSRWPCPDWGKVLPALPLLQDLISNRFSDVALKSALWAISYISKDNIQEILDGGCLPHFVDYLYEGDREIWVPSLRTLSNLLTGTDSQTDRVLSFEKVLPRLFELTENGEDRIRRDALWAVSNIAAGTSQQIEMIIENERYVERIKTAVATETQEIAEEAGWAICNMISQADQNQVDRIVKKLGVMESFTHIFTGFADDLKKEAFEVLRTLLQERDGADSGADYENYIKKAGLIEIIKELGKDSEFSEEANSILEYFTDLGGQVEKADTNNEKNQDESEQEDSEHNS